MQFADDFQRRAGSGARDPCELREERIDLIRFLAGCRKRRLNQAPSVLCLIPGSF